MVPKEIAGMGLPDSSKSLCPLCHAPESTEELCLLYSLQPVESYTADCVDDTVASLHLAHRHAILASPPPGKVQISWMSCG